MGTEAPQMGAETLQMGAKASQTDTVASSRHGAKQAADEAMAALIAGEASNGPQTVKELAAAIKASNAELAIAENRITADETEAQLRLLQRSNAMSQRVIDKGLGTASKRKANGALLSAELELLRREAGSQRERQDHLAESLEQQREKLKEAHDHWQSECTSKDARVRTVEEIKAELANLKERFRQELKPVSGQGAAERRVVVGASGGMRDTQEPVLKMPALGEAAEEEEEGQESYGQEAPQADQLSVDELITLTTQWGHTGSGPTFKLKRNSPLSKLMNAFCEKTGLLLDRVVFLQNGWSRIREDDTAHGLGIGDGGVITVMFDVVGAPDADWFYLVDDVTKGDDGEVGPMKFLALCELSASSTIDEKTEVWRKGMETWQPLSETREWTEGYVARQVEAVTERKRRAADAAMAALLEEEASLKVGKASKKGRRKGRAKAGTLELTGQREVSEHAGAADDADDPDDADGAEAEVKEATKSEAVREADTWEETVRKQAVGSRSLSTNGANTNAAVAKKEAGATEEADRTGREHKRATSGESPEGKREGKEEKRGQEELRADERRQEKKKEKRRVAGQRALEQLRRAADAASLSEALKSAEKLAAQNPDLTEVERALPAAWNRLRSLEEAEKEAAVAQAAAAAQVAAREEAAARAAALRDAARGGSGRGGRGGRGRGGRGGRGATLSMPASGEGASLQVPVPVPQAATASSTVEAAKRGHMMTLIAPVPSMTTHNFDRSSGVDQAPALLYGSGSPARMAARSSSLLRAHASEFVPPAELLSRPLGARVKPPWAAMRTPPPRAEGAVDTAPVGSAAAPHTALTSHTVLVIDVSGSMSKHDCYDDHEDACGPSAKSRQEAVLSSLFDGLIRPQLAAGAGPADVLSLITFSSSAAVSFSCVPFPQATEALRVHQPIT